MLIYKIFRAQEWETLQDQGVTEGAPIDIEDGFIHFSTAEQARETAAKHFAGEDALILAAVDAGSMGSDLKWEASRGGALFPHLYKSLRITDVVWHEPLRLDGDIHVFPMEMA